MLGIIIAFVYGVIFGSFVNAAVWRIRTRRRIAKGRSMCPECKHTLSARDLIPVVSWLMLRGKCRYCSKPISFQYPLVEFVTGLLFGLSYAAMNPHSILTWVVFCFWLYFVVVFMVLAVYDLRWLLLPDKVLLPAICIAGVMQVTVAVATHSWQPLVSSLAAALLVGGLFYTVAAVSKGKWLGGGDIKLVFLIGLLLGLSKLALAMLIAFNSAAVIGVVLILARVKSRKDYIPFGPFLVAGTIIAMLYGKQIIDFYLGLNGLGLS